MQVCDEKTFQTIRRYLHYGPLTEDFEPPLRPDDSPPASLTSEVYLGMFLRACVFICVFICVFCMLLIHVSCGVRLCDCVYMYLYMCDCVYIYLYMCAYTVKCLENAHCCLPDFDRKEVRRCLCAAASMIKI